MRLTRIWEFLRIWELTYRIVSGEEKDRVKVVNRDPDNLLVDNLLVQWVPGGKTITEILNEDECKTSQVIKTSFLRLNI